MKKYFSQDLQNYLKMEQERETKLKNKSALSKEFEEWNERKKKNAEQLFRVKTNQSDYEEEKSKMKQITEIPSKETATKPKIVSSQNTQQSYNSEHVEDTKTRKHKEKEWEK